MAQQMTQLVLFAVLALSVPGTHARRLVSQAHPECRGMKDEQGCELAMRALAKKQLTASPAPGMGGGMNKGMFKIQPGDMLAKLSHSKTDYGLYQKNMKANPGLPQDDLLAWPKQAFDLGRDELGTERYLYVMPKAPGEAIQDRISADLNGNGAPLDGTFMRKVGQAVALLYKKYCNGCNTGKACHGDLNAANAFITREGKVTFIDLDGLNHGSVPEHDMVHMRNSITIFKNFYSAKPQANKFFDEMSNSLGCGWEDECGAVVPAGGFKTCTQDGSPPARNQPAGGQQPANGRVQPQRLVPMPAAGNPYNQQVPPIGPAIPQTGGLPAGGQQPANGRVQPQRPVPMPAAGYPYNQRVPPIGPATPQTGGLPAGGQQPGNGRVQPQRPVPIPAAGYLHNRAA